MSQFIVIINSKMQNLACKCCHRLSDEFSILKCDHVVCAECLWGELKASLAGTNSIRCPCGQTTTFTSKSILTSPYATAHISNTGSPRRPQSFTRPLKTQTIKMSNTKLSNMSYVNSSKCQMGKDSLSSELQFLGIQFRKSIEETERNFKLIIQSFGKKFESLVANIRLFWLEEVVQSEPVQLVNLSKLLDRKYHKSIGHKLHNLNEALLQNLTKFRIATEHYCADDSRMKLNKSRVKIEGLKLKCQKQNIFGVQNSLKQREKLLNAIQQLKQGRGLQKMRKNAKYKFI